MSAIQLTYRHAQDLRPLYLKHTRVEDLAFQVRQQLLDADALALPLAVLAGITALRVNGLTFNLCVDTEHVVHDEQDQPVLGVCEFDPGLEDTALISVAPASAVGSAGLVLSTLAHELGHACFEVPHWVYQAQQGPDLCAAPESGSKVYRSQTRDPDHLMRPNAAATAEMFAELRANEFMGSLLVPRLQLRVAAQAYAPQLGINVHTVPALWPEIQAQDVRFMPAADAPFAGVSLMSLYQQLGLLFGVSARFIEVRMQHYGFVADSNLTH